MNEYDIFKIFLEIFSTNKIIALILHQKQQKLFFILWGDETFGRHALSSRG